MRSCAQGEAQPERQGLGEALRRIAGFVDEVHMDGTSWARVFSSPELDRLCLDLGRLSAHRPEAPGDPERTVFLLTAVAGIGGHTRVLMDLINADPGTRVTLLISNVFHALQEEEVRAVLGPLGKSVDVEVAPPDEGNLASTLSWLRQRLAALRPARTYILQHPFDAVIVAAAQPELVGRLFYFHNSDHSLTLGAHIPHATHIDFNAKGYHHCRDVEGIRNGVCWPLVAEVAAPRVDMPFRQSGQLRTATSGGLPKFDTSYLAKSVPYLHEYPVLLPQILARTGGEHIHIGPLRRWALSQIREGLAAHGIKPEKFIHLPSTPGVAAELARREVDLYLGSFPLGGGRANVEMMGLGLPLLLHDNYVSEFFTDVGETYEGVLTWRDTDQLFAILESLTPELLAEHAGRARAFYLARCHPEHLRVAVLQTLAGNPPSPPILRNHIPNALQSYLDRREAHEGPLLDYPRAEQAVRNIKTTHLNKILIKRLFLLVRNRIFFTKL